MLNDVTRLMVGKADGSANTGTSLETIQKGDILIVDYNTGAVLTGGANTVADHPTIQFAAGIGNGEFLLSSPIDYNKIVAADATAYQAEQAQIMCIGYDGTSGNLPAVNETIYSGRIVYKDDLRLIANRQTSTDFSVKTSASASEYELAWLIVEDILRQEQVYVKARTKTNGTQANIGTSATATCVRGSKEVVFSSAHGLSVNDIVYFPNGGVYKVGVVTSSTVIQLDHTYVGISEVHAADTAKSLTSVTAYGVELEAVEIPTKSINLYEAVSFEVGLSEEFGLEPSETQAYKKGTGKGIQMRELEHRHIGNLGITDFMDFRTNKDIPYQTDVSKNYNTFQISHKTSVEGDLQEMRLLPVAVNVLFSTDANTQRTAVLAILNPWLNDANIASIAF